MNKNSSQSVTEPQKQYVTYDLMEQYEKLPLIPRNHGAFKGMELEHLDHLGWRWTDSHIAGLGRGYFIPYFDRGKKHIPFAQVRHLAGDRRFTFLKDARIIAYGMWNLDNQKLFVCEGASDGAVLDYCAVPWIALPSSSSGQIIKNLAKYAEASGINLIYAGDNDEAGDKLKEALSEVTSYRVRQPPKKYNDWGDFFLAEGYEAVVNWCDIELLGINHVSDINVPEIPNENLQVQIVLDMFSGGKELDMVAPRDSSKERSYGAYHP